MPAASASSSTSRAASRTRSSPTRSRSSTISSIAAPSAPTRCRATAPASSSRSRTTSSRKNARSSASRCRAPGRLRRRPHLHAARRAPARQHCERVWTRIIKEEGLELLGWRAVPVDNSSLSEMVIAHRAACTARCSSAARRACATRTTSSASCILPRKVVSNSIQEAYKGRDIGHYTVSLSSRTLVYKGMFLSYQVGAYYKDLSDPRFVSAMALVHQRFSTNTFPSLEARASLPLRRAQRRDQHAARQRQLDGGAPGLRVLAAVRRRHREAVADLL